MTTGAWAAPFCRPTSANARQTDLNKMSLVRGLVALSVAIGATTHAQTSSDGALLIDSCQELIKIYANQQEKRFSAGLRTSVADAFKAGYCKGAIETYRPNNHLCESRTWYSQAQDIAQQPAAFGNAHSAALLLAMSCTD